jgi:hypothetical protein
LVEEEEKKKKKKKRKKKKKQIVVAAKIKSEINSGRKIHSSSTRRIPSGT